MNRTYIIAAGAVMVIAVITAGILVFRQEKRKPENDSFMERETSLEQMEETDSIGKPKTEVCEAYFENASYITVEKVQQTCWQKADGSYESSYDAYLVADLELKGQKEYTEDYTEAMAGTQFDDTKVKKVSFQDAFGFAYAGKNGWEIYQELLKGYNLQIDLEEASFDAETYELTTQKLFLLSDDEAVYNHLLDGEDYDEIIGKKICYQTGETEDGLVYPDCFTVSVQMKQGEDIVTKKLFLQTVVNQ